MTEKKFKCQVCKRKCYGELCKSCWKIYKFPSIKEKLIKSNTGRIAWNKGLTKKESLILLNMGKKVSNKLKGKMINEKNPMWKGNNVKYRGLHSWIERKKKKPKVCEECKTNPPKDLANISGEYKRDINDFEWLCRRCHFKKHRGKEKK